MPIARVNPDFFETYQIPILEGRTLTADDGDTALVINDLMAKRFFGELSPIGRRFRLETGQPWMTVVGVRVPIFSAATMNERVAEMVAGQRFVLILSSAFTGCAVLIGAVGVYGVAAYWVVRRKREMAIRLALGASPNQVAMTVVARSIRMAVIGTIAGLAIAIAGERLMQSLLFDVDPRDPATLVATTLALGAIAVVACVGPALKASRLDPMTTLRAE